MLFSVVIYETCYAFYVKLPFDFTGMFIAYFLYILLPISLLGVNIAMIYYLYQRFITGEKADDSIWGAIGVIFFVLVFSFTFVALIKTLFSKKFKMIDSK